MGNKRVPEMRFPGFTDAWEQRKASDIFVTVSDKGYVNLPVLSASQEFGMIRRDEIGIDIKYNEKSTKNYKRVKPGQFVIHLRSFQGGFAWSEIEGITSPAYTILDYKEPEKQVPKFWKEVLTSSVFIKRLETVTYGIRDGRSISFADFSTLKFNVPSVREQTQIGGFFKEVDNLITLHQRKLDGVKNLKAGMLQKMFPKNDEKYPEIRFPGFSDAWEQRRLGDLSESFEYGLNAAATEFDGINKYIRITDIDDETRLFKTEEVTSPDIDLSLAEKYKLKDGDILFARTGASVGKTYIYRESEGLVYYAGFLIRARIKSDYVPEFVFQNTLTSSYDSFIKITSQRSGQPGVNAQEYSEYKILVPSKEEQKKIGDFFTQLDHLTTLHQQELETLKQTKKAFLQKMFV